MYVRYSLLATFRVQYSQARVLLLQFFLVAMKYHVDFDQIYLPIHTILPRYYCMSYKWQLIGRDIINEAQHIRTSKTNAIMPDEIDASYNKHIMMWTRSLTAF